MSMPYTDTNSCFLKWKDYSLAAVKFNKYLRDSPLYSQQFPVPEHVFPQTRQVLSVKDVNKLFDNLI